MDSLCLDWSIENFSFCPQKCGEYLQSPYFKLLTSMFSLRLYPRGTIDKDYSISFSLCRREGDEGDCKLAVFCIIQMLSSDGEVLLEKQNRFQLGKYCISEINRLLNRNDMFKQKNLFLTKDMLKIRLILSDLYGINSLVRYFEGSASCDCSFFTVLNVEKYSFIWNLQKKFLNRKEITLSEKHMFVMTGIIKDAFLKLSIETINTKRFMGVVKCKISLLQKDDSEKVLRESEILIDGICNVLPISRELTFSVPEEESKVLQLRIPDGLQLTRLRCELAFSHAECEEDNNEANNDCCKAPPLKPNVKPDQISDNHDLFQDFLNMYTTEKMTDVTLRVNEQMFQAHRFVLSARSPVFSAMFENEMLENQNGVVDIKDVDADTLKYFLHYLYGGTIQKLNKEVARKLILVADRYLVISLKEICSSFLASNITEETICEILILADMINDKNLKETAIKFFMSHTKVILESSEWKHFQENHLKLATEALVKFAMESCSKSSK